MENEDHTEDNKEKRPFGLERLLHQQKILEYELHHLKEERANYIKTLPDLTKRRVLALKKLQKEYLMVEAKFYEEIHKIACQLQHKLGSVFSKRESIINGTFTPNDDDLYISDTEETETSPAPNNPAGFVDSGISDFWLTVLKANDMTGDLIFPQDEPVLSKLTNVKVVWHDSEPLGFTLEFYFSPNEYFSNSVLTKTYSLKFQLDETDPFSYEGPEICKSKGCNIDWLKGKDVTIKTVRKKQKHRGGSMTRVVTKTVKVPSFFNFFSPPKIPADADLIDDDTQEEINNDFEIGHYMKDRLVPRAVLYYTGEALDDESSVDSDDEYEESDEEDLENGDVNMIKNLIDDSVNNAKNDASSDVSI